MIFFYTIFWWKNNFPNKIKVIICFSCSLTALFTKIKAAPSKSTHPQLSLLSMLSMVAGAQHCMLASSSSSSSVVGTKILLQSKEKELFHLWGIMQCWKGAGKAIYSLSFSQVTLLKLVYFVPKHQKFLNPVLKLLFSQNRGRNTWNTMKLGLLTKIMEKVKQPELENLIISFVGTSLSEIFNKYQ